MVNDQINSPSEKKLLEKLFTDWSGGTAYSGSQRNFLLAAREKGYKKGLRGIQNFLQGTDSYTLTYPARKKYEMSYYPCSQVGQLYEADLISLIDIKDHNSGFCYILVVVDCLSRFIFLRALKNKSGEEMVRALDDIVHSGGLAPRYFRTDSGTEFKNDLVARFCKKWFIEPRTGLHTHKAGLSEINVRRVMKRLSRYFIHNNTYKYIDILQEVAHSLNMTKLPHLGNRTPNEVMCHGRENRLLAYDVWYHTVKQHERVSRRVLNKQAGFSKGDSVRVSSSAHPFKKGYAKNYSTQIYVIAEIDKKFPVWMFHLKDANGKLITGSFYPDEIQKVSRPKSDYLYQIDKILKERKNPKTRRKEFFVSFIGYDKSHNSWIDGKDIVKYK